jgi:hypothetical protein
MKKPGQDWRANDPGVLYPEGKSVSELPYPRAKSHRRGPVAIRVRLGERAQAIGAALNAAVA